VSDQIGDGVGDRDGREQRGELDHVASPVVDGASVLCPGHIRHVWSHAATVKEWCCVITNGL
jgi:hypothetical protein